MWFQQTTAFSPWIQRFYRPGWKGRLALGIAGLVILPAAVVLVLAILLAVLLGLVVFAALSLAAALVMLPYRLVRGAGPAGDDGRRNVRVVMRQD